MSQLHLAIYLPTAFLDNKLKTRQYVQLPCASSKDQPNYPTTFPILEPSTFNILSAKFLSSQLFIIHSENLGVKLVYIFCRTDFKLMN
jgi:hypothetical protein